jgi:hypothetical protein
MEDVTIAPSRARAPIGTPIQVYLNYTLRLPHPGCYIFTGEPNLVASSNPPISLGHTCANGASGEDFFHVLVNATSTLVRGHIRFAWDGNAPSDAAFRLLSILPRRGHARDVLAEVRRRGRLRRRVADPVPGPIR